MSAAQPTILDRLEAVVRRGTAFDGPLKADMTLAEDLSMDSLDRVSLALSIEEEFGVDVSDDDVEEMTTVARVVAVIERGQAR